MYFTITGKLFKFVSSTDKEKKEILQSINKSSENSQSKKHDDFQFSWNIDHPVISEPLRHIPDENVEQSDVEYFNYIRGYDKEFFRLLEEEEKMCEGLSEEPILDEEN